MKLSGMAPAPKDVKASFSREDGVHIVLDFTQGAHGRATCGQRTYDLPDPRVQLVTVRNPSAVLEIYGNHGKAAPMGEVSVRAMKVIGDVQMPILRADRFDLMHSSVSANEMTGPKEDTAEQANTITDIRMSDSRITSRGEINFLNLASDDNTESFVQAKELEGATAQGRLFLSADRLLIGVVEAEEIQVSQADGCRVAQIFCDKVLLRSGLGVTRPVRPVYDKDLTSFMNSLVSMPGIEPAEEVGMDMS